MAEGLFLANKQREIRKNGCNGKELSDRLAFNKQSLGKSGEDFAVQYLAESGLKIITRNYRCPKGEMDIIARDGETLVFIEVRTRRSSFRGWGEESITRQKVQRLHAIASFYVIQQGYSNWPSLRFDVLAIRWIGVEPETKWFKAAI